MQKIFLLVFAMFLILGCSKTDTANSNDVIYDKRDHKLQSKELKEIMFTLDMSIYNTYKSELEKEDTKVRYSLKLSEDVLKIALRLEHMATTDFNQRLSEQDKIIYNDSLGHLKRSAESIKSSAEKYEVEKLDEKLVQLKQSCTTCHKRFGVGYAR